MKYFILLCILFTFIFSFCKTNNRISVYEIAERFSIYDHSKTIKRHEIINLFIKHDTLWKENENYQKTDTFYKLVKGIKGSKLHGYYNKDTIYYFSRRENYYAPKIKLSNKNDFEEISLGTSGRIYKFCFLTDNKTYKRNTKLKLYVPNQNDVSLLKGNLLTFLQTQYSKFCEKGTLDNLQKLSDSLGFVLFDLENLKVDNNNTFVDSMNNKLICFIVPNALYAKNSYPFNEWCFREDNGYDGLKITCYINNQNQITYLADELTYLEHGDFDNDGKDEFLFWYSIFNHEGFVLYYDDFKKTAEFKWSYH